MSLYLPLFICLYLSEKYESDGGPSAEDIIGKLLINSSQYDIDLERFITILALKWAIADTDGHGKNYSLLLGKNGEMRLAPFYDIASTLMYPKEFNPHKIEFAMGIGGERRLKHIAKRHWEKLAKAIPFAGKLVIPTVEKTLKQIEIKTPQLAASFIQSGNNSTAINKLNSAILSRVLQLTDQF